MITHFLEATDGMLHGKFMLGRLTKVEARTRTALPELDGSIFRNAGGARKFRPEVTLVLDLQTAQGAGFLLSDWFSTRDELQKLKAWVCPMYRPTVMWLTEHAEAPFAELPRYVEIDLAALRRDPALQP
jgi:hypothetical protein